MYGEFMRNYLFYFVLFFILFLQLQTEEEPEKWGVGIQPIIGYDDDTSWVFGAAGVFYYNPNPSDINQELDELDLTGTYNLRGGYEINADIIKNFKRNDRVLELITGYQNIISDDYGINGQL